MRLGIGFICAIAIAVLAVGCGSSGDGDGSTNVGSVADSSSTTAQGAGSTQESPGDGDGSEEGKRSSDEGGGEVGGLGDGDGPLGEEAENESPPILEKGSAPPDTPVEGTKPLTKAKLIEEGDLLCRRASLSISSELAPTEGKKAKKPSKKETEEQIVDVVMPIIQREAGYLDALAPPPGDEDEMDAIVKALEDGVAKTEANPGLVLEGKNPLAKAESLSRKYGFKVCGN